MALRGWPSGLPFWQEVDQAVGKDVDQAVEEDMDQAAGQDVDQAVGKDVDQARMGCDKWMRWKWLGCDKFLLNSEIPTGLNF